MPTYQYRCTECGSEIERVQKFSDPALTVCESCGGTLRKVYNAVGVVFKGSGFYATDNRTKGSSAAASSSSSSDKAASSSESSSSSSSKDSTSSSSSTASSD
ncbi:FmdB family zinc ribbon protein [Luteococcus sp.]|uniref:FmdB family zinc ribbon protein n=1 Tax=Luteococcus sp. TaxID=1969402 RepID=UPI0037366C12